MRWIAQIGHVSAKDLRYSRWMIVLLLIASALAVRGFVTHDAFGPIVTTSSSSSSVTLSMSEVTVTWLPLVILVAGIIVLASMVQAERPLQADSFWTTRPLSPTAAFAAKLLLAMVAITAPPLLAGAVALRGLHVPGAAVAGMLAHAALVHLSLLAATMLVAVLTDDVKGFVTACVALFATEVALVSLVELVLPVFELPSALSWVAPVLALALLVFLYQRRMSGPGWRAAGFAVVLLAVLGATVAPTFNVSHVPEIATGPRLSLTFGAPGPTSMILPFRVRVDDTSSARFAFARVETVISGEHGRQYLGPIRDTLVVGPQFPDIGRPVHWLTPPFDFPVMGQLAISPADSHTVARGATSAELSGTVSILRPRVLATIPLRNGEMAEQDGRFIGIYGVAHDSARLSVYVHTVNPLIDRHQPEFVVANFSRGEAVLLDEHPSAGSGSGWVVLPWITVASSFDQFATNSSTPVPRDSSWYAGASLVAVEWIPVSQYRASATMRLR